MIYLLHQEVSLYLSPLRRQKSSTPLAVFTIPALSTTWNRLAVQVRHLLRPYQPPTWTWIATFLPWTSWEVSFVFQVEGGTVRLFLNCQPADSTSIGRHQVIYAFCILEKPEENVEVHFSESGIWPGLFSLHWTGVTVGSNWTWMKFFSTEIDHS